MKKIFITLLCLLTLCSFGNKSKHSAQKDGDRIEHNRLFVEEVIKDGDAIARWYDNRLVNYERRRRVLFLRKEGSSYYDRQAIDIPEGEYMEQVLGRLKLKDQHFERTVSLKLQHSSKGETMEELEQEIFDQHIELLGIAMLLTLKRQTPGLLTPEFMELFERYGVA